MKILFLTNRIPYPPFRGDKLKIYNLAKRLCKCHELHLITFIQNDDEWKYKSELEKIFKKVQFVSLPKWKSTLFSIKGIFNVLPFQVNYFRSKKMFENVKQLLADDTFDAVHVQHLRMAQYMQDYIHLPRVLDLPDAFSLYWSRKYNNTKSPLLKLFSKIEQGRVYRYESVLNRFPLALVCSIEDKEYLEKKHKLTNIKLLENGVDIDTFKTNYHNYAYNETLLFTGNMDYGPNVDAVVYFSSNILPIIRDKYPNIKFIIAGQRPISKVKNLENDFIKVTGFVSDLAAQYNNASVVVSPLRFGAGTQNKVLEAMSMGVPVVCSEIGFKGLGIANGEGVIMETDPHCFAQSVIKLLSSENLRKEMGEKGKLIIQNRFSWDIIYKKLENYFEEVVSKK